MSESIRLSSVTVNCPNAVELAEFYAAITGGAVTYAHPEWATMQSEGGRIDFQTVDDFVAPTWPANASARIHLDFFVEDLEQSARKVVNAGAARFDDQPNAEHCLVFADPVGHPFCLTLLDEIG